MERKKVIIIGAGEHGQVALSCLRHNPDLEFVGFLDAHPPERSQALTVGTDADYGKFKNCLFYIAINNIKVSQRIFDELKSAGCQFVNLIHPTAFIEDGVKFGQGVFIGAFSYINVGSIIGDNTIINNHCNIDHDNVVGRHCRLAPGVITGGGVKIGDQTMVGLNVTIRDHKTVGDDCFLGMGSVIVKDIPDKTLVRHELKWLTKENC